MRLLELQQDLGLLIYIGIFLMEAFAFIDAVSRPAEAFTATDKMTKTGWLIILGLAVGLTVLNVAGLLYLVGVVAAIVYIVDVRPAIQAITRR